MNGKFHDISIGQIIVFVQNEKTGFPIKKGTKGASRKRPEPKNIKISRR